MTVLETWRLRRRPAGSPPPRPREAFVLSGGGSVGAVQVGALLALFEAGIRPDLLVGCSVGALNAAFVAVDPTLERVRNLDRVWHALDRRDVFGGGRRLVATHLVRGDAHLYEPTSLRKLVRTWVPLDELADTVVPCHVVTTDLLTGEPCWWSAGDPVAVPTASACLPAIFPPVALGGSLHVDGGVTCPVPLARALQLGAVRTWVLDVRGGTLGRSDARMTALDVLLLSFAISRSHLHRAELPAGPGQQVVRLPGVQIGHLEMRDFSQTDRLIAAGYDAGRAAVLSVAA